MAANERDDITGTETTGHEWDGIRELNTPLPRWWLWTFYATIIWSLGYVVAYPAIPLITDATSGLLGWSSRIDIAEDISRARQAQGGMLERIANSDLESINSDPDLQQFAIAGGRSAYSVNCSQCHGSGAAGSAGYPNLNDDDWIWGGDLEAIYTTIAHGVRHDADDETRISDMPAFGADELLERQEISDVAEHVLSLSGLEHDAEAAATGKEIYMDNCAACHGDTGEGNRDLGAPALADSIWLYGGDKASIVAQIHKAKHGVMPAWRDKLDDVTIKKLAVFVHALGGGE